MKPLTTFALTITLGLPLATTAQEKSVDSPTPQTFARFVPERADDFAWENDLIAFRAYGPALRDKTEDSGIDCWLKRVDYPIINKWYKQSAEGKSYHKDHGEGVDSYKVGASAGCGGTGIWLNGKREPLNTFTRHEVIQVTPQRSQFKLIYERTIDGVVYGEEKTITIALGTRLFSVDSLFLRDGKPAPNLPVCIGLNSNNGKGTPSSSKEQGWIATWESHGDSELGTGARMDPKQIDEIKYVKVNGKLKSHIFLLARTNEQGELRYEAGYGWKKAGTITSRQLWEAYLGSEK